MTFDSPEIGAKPLSAVGRGIDDLKNEFYEQSVYWEKRDEPAMSALFSALFYESLVNPDLEAVMADVISVRRLNNDDLSTSEVAGTWRVTLFDDQLQLGHQPQNFTERDQWQGPLNDLIRLVTASNPSLEESERAERLQISLISESTGTNPFSRATPDEILMQTLNQRFPDGYRWLDIGTGMVEIPNQILQKKDFPFGPVKLYGSENLVHGAKDWAESPKLTKAARRLLARDHLVQWCLAVDLVDPYKSEYTKKRSLASLRGSELANKSFLDTYLGLAAKYHSLLEYKSVDLTLQHDTERLRAELGDQKFDIITMSTVQHQLSKQERRDMDRNAVSLLAPGGILFKKDFLSVSPSQPHAQRFFKNWHQKGRYRGFVYDPAHTDMGWQEFCRNYDSRCKDIVVGSGRIAISGKMRQFENLILSAGELARREAVVIDLAGQKPNLHNAS